MEPSPADAVLFVVMTPLGFSVRTTHGYWTLISTIKHPVMRGCVEDVRTTLANPDEVRASRSDPSVLLFYRTDGDRRWVCAVAKQAGDLSFLVTAYRTRAIKEGAILWRK